MYTKVAPTARRILSSAKNDFCNTICHERTFRLLLACCRQGRRMVVGDHPSTVAFYDYHREVRWAGNIVFRRPSKIVKSSSHDRSVAENDRSSLDNRILTTALRQFLKLFSYPLCTFGDHWAGRSSRIASGAYRPNECVAVICTVRRRPLVDYRVSLICGSRKRNCCENCNQ